MSYKWFGDRVLNEMRALTETKLTVLAAEVQKESKALMAEPKTGAVPPQKKKGRKQAFKHRRSAPGEAPAIQTGELMRSIQIEKPGPMARRIGTTIKRGVYLEVGTRHIQARPYLRPALDKVKPHAEAILRSP